MAGCPLISVSPWTRTPDVGGGAGARRPRSREHMFRIRGRGTDASAPGREVAARGTGRPWERERPKCSVSLRVTSASELQASPGGASPAWRVSPPVRELGAAGRTGTFTVAQWARSPAPARVPPPPFNSRWLRPGGGRGHWVPEPRPRGRHPVQGKGAGNSRACLTHCAPSTRGGQSARPACASGRAEVRACRSLSVLRVKMGAPASPADAQGAGGRGAPLGKACGFPRRKCRLAGILDVCSPRAGTPGTQDSELPEQVRGKDGLRGPCRTPCLGGPGELAWTHDFVCLSFE